jgi:hypothetical protein
MGLTSLQHPIPSFPTRATPTSGPITKALPPDGETPDRIKGTLDGMGPPLDIQSHANPPGQVPMVLESSYLHEQLAGSIGNLSKAGRHLDMLTAAPDYRAGTGSRRNATVAPVRLFSKAAIYPYASQGLSCQGADATVLATATYGGPTYCLDIRGSSTADGAEV